MTDSGETSTEEDQDLWYLRRLDGGLFTLQTVDYILAWIIMEDDGVSSCDDTIPSNLQATRFEHMHYKC
jgi:hypothetical protein